MSLPKLAITFGDPAGIGPEIVYKSLLKREIFKICRPVLVGSFSFAKKQGFDFGRFRCDMHEVGDVRGILLGQPTATSGEVSYRSILKAVESAVTGEVKAIVTAPISKEALNSAGYKYSGHTELLAKLTGINNFAMLMAAKNYRVVMVTRHLPLREVSEHLSVKEIYRTALLTCEFLKSKAGIKRPRVGVLAFNPHAGEAGLIGDEELKLIVPAVKKLAARGINAVGPLPSDSAWLKEKNGAFDLLVAMYHDQAMTGLKLLAPECIVNATLGLPFIRTSPGHGTAFDIAGQNIADPRPMAEAIAFAAKFCGG